MESAWEKVQPKNIFRVAKQLPLDSRRKEALIHLYQPIIGSMGMGLYLTLLADIQNQYGISETLLHADLLIDCDISIQQFYETRSKLEGIGLLSCFVKQDKQGGKAFLYQLHDPLIPESFLKDDLLVFLLKERVSESKFKQLLQLFSPKLTDTSDYVETTKAFKEIYNFHQQKFAAEYSQITNYCQPFDVSDEKVPVSEEDFDWSLIVDLMGRQGIVADFTQDEKKEIVLYHTLYGASEIELADLLAKTANITDAKINLKEFKKAFRQLTQKKKIQKNNPAESLSDFSDEEKQTYRYNTLKLEGFTDLDMQIIKESEQYPPMTYFQAIKEQKGGYITEPENWVIRDLVNKSGLPNSVINFLIHYVLVVRNAPVLNASYVNTIANEWAQKKIHSPEAALKHIRKVNQPTDKKTKSSRKRSYDRRVRTEKVPEWMNKQSIPAAKLSPERQAELDEKLKDFLKEGD